MAKAGAPIGNNNAAKNKPWRDAISKFAKQNPDKRDKVIEKLYQMAVDGDMAAIREIIDRTEGKAVQAIETGEGGFDIRIVQ